MEKMLSKFKLRGHDVESLATEGLLQSEKLDEVEQATIHNRARSLQFKKLSVPVLIHLTLIALYTFAFFTLQDHRLERTATRSHIYSPAEDVIKWQSKRISVQINATRSIYAQGPDEESDKAWSALFKHANIRLKPEELARMGRSSIKFADGSGDYFGTLDMYHQLHCVKYIREYVHQEYYELPHTNVPNTEHVDHCIEMLREVVMCKADISMMTYSWLPDFPGPWPSFDQQHECANWEEIDAWAKHRSIDVFNPKYLQHPKFGFSYKNLKGIENHVIKDEDN